MRAAKESITVPTRSWLLVESSRTVLPFRECIREFLLFWQTKSQLSLSAVGGVVVAEIVVELFRQPAWGSVPAQPIKNFKRACQAQKTLWTTLEATQRRSGPTKPLQTCTSQPFRPWAVWPGCFASPCPLLLHHPLAAKLTAALHLKKDQLGDLWRCGPRPKPELLVFQH